MLWWRWQLVLVVFIMLIVIIFTVLEAVVGVTTVAWASLEENGGGNDGAEEPAAVSGTPSSDPWRRTLGEQSRGARCET